MKMIHRELNLNFQLDTNRINSRGKLENMNRLEYWDKRNIISILYSDTMIDEAIADNDVLRTEKAWSDVFTKTSDDAHLHHVMLRQIESIVFPNGAKTQNERNDVQIVFTAWKYGRTLITNDGGSKRQPGGILGNQETLRKLGIKVTSDDEAVKLVIEKLRERDEIARRIAEILGEPLPDWLGQD